MNKSILTVGSLHLVWQSSLKKVIENLSFEVAKGEILALAGESGSGKSTLLTALAGFMEPASGQIIFDGKPLPGPLSKLVPGHEDILLAFQDSRLEPMLSLRENIYVALRGYKPYFKEQQTKILLEILKIDHLAHKKPVAISGGEKQRAALAKALATMPKIVLLDEPFSNLDYNLKREITGNLLQLLKNWGCTVIFVSHDPNDTLSLSDRILLLKNGKLEQEGSPVQVFEEPKTAYTARFFGETNLFTREEMAVLLPEFNLNPEPNYTIRPNHILVSPQQVPGLMGAKLQSVRYFGAYFRLSIEYVTEMGQVLEIVAHKREISGLALGQSVWFGFDVDKVVGVEG